MIQKCDFCGSEFEEKPGKKPRKNHFCKPTHQRRFYQRVEKANEPGKSHRRKPQTSRDYIENIRRYCGPNGSYLPPKCITEAS